VRYKEIKDLGVNKMAKKIIKFTREVIDKKPIEKSKSVYVEKKEVTPIYIEHNKMNLYNPNKYKIWNMASKNQLDKIPPLYSQDGKRDKTKVYMKLFTPNMTYYVTEFDKKTGDMYGYVQNEGDLEMSEWGYTNYNELKTEIAKSKGLTYLDRDIHFKPTTIGELKKGGRIYS
jgi:hypothetical protein